MNQREKDENYAKGHYNGPCTSSDLYLCQGFADGAEYGRKDLAKRILTALDTGNGLQEVIDICRGLKNG